MGEIKSAFELAIERSKKFAISDAEREEIKEKELLQRAMGLFHRYKEGHFSVNEMMREIERMDEKTRERVKEVLLSHWVDALSLDEDSERFLDAIGSIKNKDLHEIKVKFQKFLAAYQKEIDRARQRMSLRLAEDLKSKGIYGDAVDPNVEGSETWQTLVYTVNHAHQGKLNEIKEALKKL